MPRSYELVFSPEGVVELRSTTDGQAYRTDWSSDEDADAAEYLENDIFDAEQDADDIIEYLIETGKLSDDDAENIEVVEEVEDDE